MLLLLHPSTLTGVLRRLEDGGVTERRLGERDRREARLRPTPAARAVDRRHAGTVEDPVRRTFGHLDRRKIAATAEVLSALNAALSATARRPGARTRRG